MPDGMLAYLHGDDEYGLDRAAAELTARAGSGAGEAPIAWKVAGAEVDAPTLIERVATATLFGGGTVALVVDPGPLARSADGRAALAGVIGAVAPGNGLIFLARLGDARRPSAGLEAIRSAVVDAGGEDIEVRAPRPDRFPGWIADRARERGVRLAPDAARELADRVGASVREGDVDRSRMSLLAVGELDKLAILADGREVTVADVRALVPETTPSSMWGFLDAVADRELVKIAQALGPVLDATPEPVIVAALHRRLRDLIEVTDRLAAGESVPSLVRSMRIKEYPARKMAAQSTRWRLPELIAALEGLADLDAAIKGEPPLDEAQRRLAFTVWIADRIATRRARRSG